MSTKHYELTGETMGPASAPLYRIRATRDLPVHGVRKGELGGWIGDKVTLTDEAWVGDSARVYSSAKLSGEARVCGRALVSGHAEVSGEAWVSGNAQVSGYARISGGAWVYGDAQVTGYAQVYGYTRVSGETKIHDEAQVYGEVRASADVWIGGIADVRDPQDLLVVGPIGSESRTAVAYRNEDGTHTLSVGCWKGTVEGLADEVEHRAGDWHWNEEDHERWRAEYAALEALVRARITAWNKEPTND